MCLNDQLLKHVNQRNKKEKRKGETEIQNQRERREVAAKIESIYINCIYEALGSWESKQSPYLDRLEFES